MAEFLVNLPLHIRLDEPLFRERHAAGYKSAESQAFVLVCVEVTQTFEILAVTEDLGGQLAQALELDQARLYGDWRETSKTLGRPAYPRFVGVRLFRADVKALLTNSVVDEGGTNFTVYPTNLMGDSRVSVTTDVNDPRVVDVLLPEDIQGD